MSLKKQQYRIYSLRHQRGIIRVYMAHFVIVSRLNIVPGEIMATNVSTITPGTAMSMMSQPTHASGHHISLHITAHAHIHI